MKVRSQTVIEEHIVRRRTSATVDRLVQSVCGVIVDDREIERDEA